MEVAIVEAKTLSLGDVARRLCVPTWRVRRLFETGVLPPARRVGLYRFFHEDDVEVIRLALANLPRRRGCLRPGPTPAA
jgi:DNA-binding transcriptional MerR regulator